MLIYVDNAATSKPLYNEVDGSFWGNPSSVHKMGCIAKQGMQSARQDIAHNLGVQPRDVFFTASGTEATNIAIKTTRWGIILSTPIEHDATRKCIAALDAQNIILPVDVHGVIQASYQFLSSHIAPLTPEAKNILITVIHTNNEIGTIQDLDELMRIKMAVHSLLPTYTVMLHLDCVQSIGHASPLRIPEFVDMVSLSAHKFHGPKGVGILICRNPMQLKHNSLLSGGGQESGVRSGTENVPGVITAAKMLCLINEDAYWKEHGTFMLALREIIIHYLVPFVLTGDVILTGSAEKRSVNMVSFCIKDANHVHVLERLNASGICASSGSACSSSNLVPSHVMTAINVHQKYLWGHIRLSFSSQNTQKEAHYIGELLVHIIRGMR